MSEEIDLQISSACEYAEQFGQIFYEKLDKSRSTFEKLYHENAYLVWNGNQLEGKNKISNFYQKLPISETELNCIDAQPVLNVPQFPNAKTISITCTGMITFKALNSRKQIFTQCFILMAESGIEKNVWKIISDNFRTS